jgi:gluconokinase
MTVLVVMGTTGSGKTTVGRRLAQRLGLPFVEGDDYHDEASIARMRRGEPLDDASRGPWLDRLNVVLREHARGRGVVLACSALTEAYRRRLTRGVAGVRFVFLRADEALLRRRLAGRRGHFAGAALVPSQLATLEPPADAITVDAAPSPEEIVDRIVATLADADPGYDSPRHRRGEDTVASSLPTPDEETDTETLLRELGDLVAALLDSNDLVRRQELWAEARARVSLLDRLING